MHTADRQTLGIAAKRAGVAGALAATAVYALARWQGETFTITVPLLGTMNDSILSFILSGAAAAWGSWLICVRFLLRAERPRITYLKISAAVVAAATLTPLLVRADLAAWFWFNVAHVAVAAAVMHFFFWALPDGTGLDDSAPTIDEADVAEGA